MAVPSTSNDGDVVGVGAGAGAVFWPHPMRFLHQKTSILRMIDDNWTDNHNIPHRFEHAMGVCKKADGFYRLAVLGSTFKLRTNEFDVAGVMHDFDCFSENCPAQLRVYGESDVLATVTKTNSVRLTSIDVELLRSHTCDHVKQQALVLKYLSIIRMHLLTDPRNELNSWTGFFDISRGSWYRRDGQCTSCRL